jgi:TolB protein
MNTKALIFVAVQFFVMFTAGADVSLEIVTQGDHPVPIAVLPFANEGGSAPQVFSQIVAADLTRSGLFTAVNTADVKPAPSDNSQINWAQLANRQADYVVVGQAEIIPGSGIEVKFRLLDAKTQAVRLSSAFRGNEHQYRMVAHHISDAILQNLTGMGGMFASHIGFVKTQGEKRSLIIADSDGYNEQVLFSTNHPIISPRWSPNGTQMAYVSFEFNRPIVVVQSLATGERKVVARFKGSNSAPTWSPDGKHLAVVLSKDGHSQIYVISPSGSGTPERLISSSEIDTEPVYSNDGKTLFFTSDRDGGPQIYQLNIGSEGAVPVRLTFGSNYAVSPRISPDGQYLAFIQRDEGRFHLMLQSLVNGQKQALTTTELDESPYFSPNSHYLLYATGSDEKSVLAIVSIDGKIRERLSSEAGDIDEPIWGPLQ